MAHADDWAALTDEELMDLVAPSTQGHGNVYLSHATAGHVEMTRRLVVALRDFKASSDQTARRLVWLTIVLVVMTGVIAWFTVELAQRPGAG